jgi:hypothetical protein
MEGSMTEPIAATDPLEEPQNRAEKHAGKGWKRRRCRARHIPHQHSTNLMIRLEYAPEFHDFPASIKKRDGKPRLTNPPPRTSAAQPLSAAYRKQLKTQASPCRAKADGRPESDQYGEGAKQIKNKQTPPLDKS